MANNKGGTETNYSNICIYGTVYIDEYGVLSIDTTNDNPYLYIYYNPNMNIFGNLGEKVAVMSFGEYTYLVPTPVPEYPSF